VTQSPSPARKPTIELVRVGGRTVRAAHWPAPGAGKNPLPILFFNGIGANIELMTPLADWFPDRAIITFDMPGVGRSPSPLLPYRPWMMARLAARLLDRYGIDKVDVMGVSWGGGMAQQFAFQHGRRVGRMILAATSAGALMVPGDIRAIAKMAHPERYMDPTYMKRHFGTLYGDDPAEAGPHVARISEPSRIGYAYQLAAMAGWTSAYWLPFVKAPTLVMMGDRDKLVPPANGKILTRLLANATLEIVKGGGHLFLVSKAAEVMPVMRAFLDGAAPNHRAKAA
jgi:poly(3-hydroxyalkanoate) depolymerase